MTVELLSRTADDDVIIRLFRVQNITRVGGRAFILKIQLTEQPEANTPACVGVLGHRCASVSKPRPHASVVGLRLLFRLELEHHDRPVGSESVLKGAPER